LEEQKGPFASGRILADIVNEESGIKEKRFLYDYAYTLFEEKLLSTRDVLLVNKETPDNIQCRLEASNFIKVTGKAVFTDIELISGTFNEFNTVGEAIAYVTNYPDIVQAREVMAGHLESIKDRNQKAALQQKLKALDNPKKLAEESGLRHDPTYLKNLAFLLKYGLGDHFEVSLSSKNADGRDTVFSSILNRKYMREPETSIIKKYSRFTEKELTLFGIITQSQKTPERTEPKSIEEAGHKNTSHLKEALMQMVRALTNIEETFFGRLDNEIIIDPIAVFREL
jgi:hypothetical protein